jgi:hypothetical protein
MQISLVRKFYVQTKKAKQVTVKPAETACYSYLPHCFAPPFPPVVLFGIFLFGVNFHAFLFPPPDMVFDSFDARATGAVGAAEEIFLRFDAVPDYPASAIGAHRRKLVNRAFETIENVRFASRYHFKRQIIIISANFALSHKFSFGEVKS